MSLLNHEIPLLITSDTTQGATNKNADGSYFEVNFGQDGIKVPNNAINVTVAVEESTIWWSVPNIIAGVNNNLRVIGPRASDDAKTTYNITVDQGLYDLSGLNTAILRQLENAGAKTSPDPIITLLSDDATQKVIIRLNYVDSSVVFVPNSPYEILGWNLNDTLITGGTAPINRIAPSTASFNTINLFLIHSDLSNKGIRYNNDYKQIITQVLIDVAPGSQIVATPFNPPKIDCPELIGQNKKSLKFWLTDDKNNLVNTNGENWSCRIVIKYQTFIK